MEITRAEGEECAPSSKGGNRSIGGVMLERFDAQLARDICGNPDVVMRQRPDGLFVHHSDHAALVEKLLGALRDLRGIILGREVTCNCGQCTERLARADELLKEGESQCSS